MSQTTKEKSESRSTNHIHMLRQSQGWWRRNLKSKSLSCFLEGNSKNNKTEDADVKAEEDGGSARFNGWIVDDGPKE